MMMISEAIIDSKSSLRNQVSTRPLCSNA